MAGKTVFTGSKFTRQDDSQSDSKILKEFPELSYSDEEIDARLDGAKSLDDLREEVKRVAKIAVRSARLSAGLQDNAQAVTLEAAKAKAKAAEVAKSKAAKS